MAKYATRMRRRGTELRHRQEGIPDGSRPIGRPEDAEHPHAISRYLMGESRTRNHCQQAFMALPLSFRESEIWHEVGHIHYEHLVSLDFEDQAQLRAARIAAIQNGQVISHEAEADRFALMRVGKDALIGFLTHLLQARPTVGGLGWNDAGRRDLELRIETIQPL
jgi:hypothetical protein